MSALSSTASGSDDDGPDDDGALDRWPAVLRHRLVVDRQILHVRLAAILDREEGLHEVLARAGKVHLERPAPAVPRAGTLGKRRSDGSIGSGGG